MIVEYSKQSVKIINRLDMPTKQRIRSAVNALPDGDIKQLTGCVNTRRLRAGDWRVLFSYPAKDVILVEKLRRVDKSIGRGNMSLAQEISLLVEQLPETEQRLILELVKRINPDDLLSPEDISDIQEARAEYARGETVSDSAVHWE